MRLVIYDIQKPVDPQVNGFGIYRTVVDGTEPMLVGRFEIPLYPRFAHTHPWESADCIESVDDQLTFNFAKASINTFNEGRVFCTMTQIWEMLDDASVHLNSEDTNGYVGTYPWEIRGEFGVGDDNNIVQTRYTYALTTILSDLSLGDPVETDHDLPPNASLVTEFQESLFLAGEDVNPHYLRWSKRFHPESWPAVNFIEIGDADDRITALCPIAGVLGVFTVKTKYRVNGNADSGFTHFEAISHRGTRAYKSVVPSEHGIIFTADDGVFTSNLIGADVKISADIEILFDPQNYDRESTRNEQPINKDYFHLISACYYKSKYRFVYPAGDPSGAVQSTINREAMYDFDVKKWTINTLAQASYLVEPDIDILTGGGQDGKLYRLEHSQSDNGTDITMVWVSKDFFGTGPAGRSIFSYFKVDAHVGVGETLLARIFVDDVAIHEFNITGHRTNVLNPLPEETVGHLWRVQLSASSDAGGIGIYGFTMFYIPLEGLANGT